MKERTGGNRFRLWLIAVMVYAAGPLEAGTSTIYSYTDDKGNFVATDSLANVPPKYRARVNAREVQDSGPRAPVQETKPETAASPQAGLESFASRLAEYFPTSLTIPGLTPGQSMGVIGGVVVGALAIVAMLLSGNPFANVFAKLFLKFVLPLLAVGVMSALYLSQVSERAATVSGKPGSSGNVFQKAQESVKTQEAAQQQRTKAIDSILEPIEQTPPPAGHR